MCRFLRYFVSHCLHAAMTRLEEVNSGDVSVWSSYGSEDAVGAAGETLRSHQVPPCFLTSAERLELAGFAVASTALLIQKSLSSWMKALLSLPNLVAFAVITGVAFFQSLHLDINPGLSVTERWQPFLIWRGLWRRLSLLPLLMVEGVFLALSTRKLLHLDTWYLLVPGFIVACLFWSICHLVFIVTVWGFHTKLSDCQRVSWSQGPDLSGLDKIMASKGMRHFCLISERLLLFTLGSTVAVGALCWQNSSSLFLSVFLLVLPLESLFHGLFYELGRSLGGTCVGYAVVIPTNYCRPETSDGPRHDTYIIYYSGHTHRSGEWALSGGDVLRMDQLVDWWKEKNGGFCSRLIVVLDCEDSGQWVREVRRVEGVYVAVQGATLSKTPGISAQNTKDVPQLGDFTSQWVEYNCNPHSDIRWSSEEERSTPSTVCPNTGATTLCTYPPITTSRTTGGRTFLASRTRWCS
ncbi:hypothetical protein WMY93_023575 [Mugilogobius chulae]|uniref:Uncharacterized protein n=1 Tax=Mugilogobius chulae TaxID=88201 RepID=A0AAW0N936_9GOBI